MYKHIESILKAPVELKKPLLGGGEAAMSLKQSQLEALEAGLAMIAQTEQLAQERAALSEKVSLLAGQLDKVVKEQGAIGQAVEAALATGKIVGGGTLVESIGLLGAKCKEYGEKAPQHNHPGNDGKEDNGLIGGYLDPKDEHNQLLASLFHNN